MQNKTELAPSNAAELASPDAAPDLDTVALDAVTGGRSRMLWRPHTLPWRAAGVPWRPYARPYAPMWGGWGRGRGYRWW